MTMALLMMAARRGVALSKTSRILLHYEHGFIGSNLVRQVSQMTNGRVISGQDPHQSIVYSFPSGQKSFSSTSPALASEIHEQPLENKDGQDSQDASPYHSIIKNDEKALGQVEKREFQAETKMLLDIVAKSLYSESEIFIRELISNASDAIEKFRYLSLSDGSMVDADRLLEIHIATDKQNRTLTIQDTGVGMTKEELIENLGTIAKSGSKAFLEQVKQSKGGSATDTGSIIGQFGVGFYSAFMVANSVEVFSKSSTPGAVGYKWTSTGTGEYELQEAEGVQTGTKIVLHLKTDDRHFSDEETVLSVVKKYSNFVGNPIFLNGKQINTVQALWLMDPKKVTTEMHDEFYHFIGGAYDRPRFILHFNTDVPLDLRCVLYVPDGKPGLFEMGKDAKVGVSLYCRKIMIKNKADNIMPNWLRFMKGVVDSEDIPLNLSREILQDGSLIRKLRTVVINRVLRFLYERSQKEPESYSKFYKDYEIFLKEGIITEPEQVLKEEISKLLQFESSEKPAGELVSIPSYIDRMKPAQKEIFYLAAPSRELAERSPYFEAMKEKNVEVLFCYQSYDEMVMLQLRQFDRKTFTSVEKEMRQMKDEVNLDSLPLGTVDKSQAESLLSWLSLTLKGRAHSVKFTQKLENHPCVVTVEEMGAARHFVKTQFATMTPEARYSILQPRLEVNVKHPLIQKLSALKTSNPDLAGMVADQIFANAMVEAGLEENPRLIINNLTQLLTKALEKH